MDPRNIFAIENRRKLYNYILKHPGLHFREISRNLKIPKTTIDYHLHYLRVHGFLVVENKNGYQRYYASRKISEADKKMLNILRQTVPRNLVLYLILFQNSSQAQILKFAKIWKNHPSKIGYHLNKHHSTISFHLQKLCDMGILERFHVGNETKYRVKNAEDFSDLLINYEKSLLAEANGRYLRWVEYDPEDKTFKRLMDALFDVFPHPYHC